MGMRVTNNGSLGSYDEGVQRDVADLVLRTAALIDNDAKAAAPFRWGTLRRAISFRMDGPFRAIIGARGVPYARIQDLGGQTSNQYGPNSGYIRPKFYLSGAFASRIPEFARQLGQILRRS